MNEQKKLPEVNIVPDIGGLAWLARRFHGGEA
jgi:hypothetical protein